MATLLENDIAPIWVWIIIIVLGSLVVALVLALSIWCMWRRSRRRSMQAGDDSEKQLARRDDQPIPDQSRQSLTGSRYSKTTTNTYETVNSPESQADNQPNRWESIEKRSPSVTRQVQREQQRALAEEASMAQDQDLYHQHLSAQRHHELSSDSTVYQKGLMSSVSSVSELSTVSKPLLPVSTSGPSRTDSVNFSRPQQRPQLRKQPSQARGSERLSVIRESTPSWYSRISRIMSFSSSDRNSDPPEPLPQPLPHVRISEKAPRVSLMQEAQTTTSSDPLDEVLAEIQRLSDAKSPEPHSRHPSGLTFKSDDQTMFSHSRSSSVTNFSRKQSHNYNLSVSSNAPKKRDTSTHSRSSSVHNFSRKPYSPDSNERRTTPNTSWVEPPKATLSEPFDSPVMMGFRESGASMWSDESYQSPAGRSQQRFTTNSLSPIPYSPRSEVVSPISSAEIQNLDLEQSRPSTMASPIETLTTPKPTFSATPHHNRNRSQSRGRTHTTNRGTTWFDDATSPGVNNDRGRSVESRHSNGGSFRGPGRVRSKNGRHVLRKKRSSQSSQHQVDSKQKKKNQLPEIRLIGAVDPSSLENLSVRDP